MDNETMDRAGAAENGTAAKAAAGNQSPEEKAAAIEEELKQIHAEAEKEEPAPAGAEDDLPDAEEEEEEDTETEAAAAVPSFLNWFITFLIMDIPVFGFITLLVWALGKNTDPVKKTFARARILYRVIFTVITLAILYVLFRLAVPRLEHLLDYLQKV